MAAQGFFLATKALGCDNLPLDPREINRAMKYADKTMSEKKIQAWVDRYFPMLYWKEDVSHSMKRAEKLEYAKLPQLYPHEFLYLISNAVSRLDYVLPISNPAE